MEVLLLSTPTSSRNYKVFLESLQDEAGFPTACRALWNSKGDLVKRNADLLAGRQIY
jgi:hypothetical protein